MSKILLFLTILYVVVNQGIAQSYSGIGDRLLRTAIIYSALPLSTDEATQDGWSQIDGFCDPNLGIAYAVNGEYGKTNPVIVYFTSAGQITGIAVVHYGDPAPGLGDYWLPQPDGTYFINVSFRPSYDPCSGQLYDETLGSMLLINQNGINKSVPLTSDDAAAQSYTQGACLSNMGTHWEYDLESAPVMSWNVSNLQPLVAMYNGDGMLSAFFITTVNLQVPEPFGDWEGPLVGPLMCLNWCDSDCSWGFNLFNTMHFYVTDHNLNTCDSRC